MLVSSHSSGIRQRVRTRRERGVVQGWSGWEPEKLLAVRKQQELFEAFLAKDFSS